MSETTFYREKKERNYTVIDNTFIKDKNLSAKAKGIMCYLLSLPDDWKIYLEELKNNFSDGKASISSGIKELMDNHYLIRKRLHDSKGKFKGYSYKVIENPNFEPKTENPSTDKPKTDKPKTDNQTLLSTNKLSTNKLSTNNKYDVIFGEYLKGGIIKHSKLTEVMKRNICKTLKKYTVEEIITGIKRYAQMRHDDTYEWCNYDWTLNEFLTREKGIGYFLDDGDKWINYQEHLKSKTKAVNIAKKTEVVL